MPWLKVNQSTFTIATGTGSESESLPSGAEEGDIVIIAMASDATMTSDGISSGQGWTNIAYTDNASPGHQVAYKVMGSTPDTSVTILQHAVSMAAGVFQIWRGCNTTTILDQTTPSDSTGTSGLPDCPSITTVTAGALVIAVGLLDDDDASASAVAPTGYSNLIAADTGQASSNAGATVFLASKEVVAPGADDPAAFTGSAGSDAWRGVTFALRPGAVPKVYLSGGAWPPDAGILNPALDAVADYVSVSN